MPSISNKQNPFEANENLTPIFEASDRYVSAKNQALQSFKSIQTPKINNKPTFNLFNFMSFNFTHLTKFSMAGLAVFTLLAGGLSAQALAPDILKPTQIAQTIKDKYFSANKQSDGDPQVALVQNELNSVKTLEGCNLNIKYPKLINGKTIDFSKSTRPNFNTIELFEKKSESYQTNLFTVFCSKEDLKYGLISEYDSKKIIKSINSDELRQKYGWFITDSKIDSIQQTTSVLKGNEIREELKFSNNGYNYIFSILKEATDTGLFLDGKDFQIQFNNQGKFAYSCIDSLNIINNANFEVQKGINEISDNIQINQPNFYKLIETNLNTPYFSIKCNYNQDGKAWDNINTPHVPLNTQELPFISLLNSTNKIKQAYVHPSEKSTFYYIELKDGKILEINYQNIEEIKKEFGISISL